jgi:ribosome-binding factor A
VFITPLGGGDQEAVSAVTDGLNRAAPFFKRMIAKQLELRAVPRLKFIPDVSFDKVSEIDALMRRADVARDLSPMPENLAKKNMSESANGYLIEGDDTEPNGA